MIEKIGNVSLDDTYYPGADLYSDGEVEEELLEIGKNTKEEELNDVIAAQKSWPVLYHFSDIRQNIIEWMPIEGETKVLEIGSGCGAITGALAHKAKEVHCIELSKKRSMINAYRNREYNNIKILLGNFQEIEENLEDTYDYITLIGVFEYSKSYIMNREPYLEMLKRVTRHLKVGGKLVIAIENRLGLKYFAGATEDHFGTYFEGIEGYSKSNGVKTFSKNEWLKMLEQFPNLTTKFYYPYPDYKFPFVIYSDEYLPKVGDLNMNQMNYDRERINLFNEQMAFDSLIESGDFTTFSNSFLLVIERTN